MNRLHIGWYGVSTIISILFQDYCRGYDTVFASYVVGNGDITATLLLALLLWAIGVGIMIILEHIFGILHVMLK